MEYLKQIIINNLFIFFLSFQDLDARVENEKDSANAASAGDDKYSEDKPQSVSANSLGSAYGKKLAVERKDVWDM